MTPVRQLVAAERRRQRGRLLGAGVCAAVAAAAAILLLVGYLGLEILDPIAARKLEAPLFFARLRPAQMAIPIACLFLTTVLLVWR